MNETEETAEAEGKKGRRKKPRKEKPPKVKKEKPPKVKKEKPPKVKKEKPPKVKKEKPPKVKKEKPPKVKKEKPPRKQKKKKGGEEGAEGEEEEQGSGGGKKKLLLILLPAVLVVAAAAVFLGTRLLGGGKDPGDDPPEESVSDEAEVPPEEGEDGEGAEDGEETEPEPTQSLQITTRMTTAEVVSYIEHLSPSVLGLEGDSMDDYELFASESIILVDGRTCTQVRVYGDGPAGTNEIKGIYFLSRDGKRYLYRYDEETNTVEQLDTGNARIDEKAGTVILTDTDGEAEGGDDAEAEAP